MENELICLCDRPELIETAAQWFHEKWGVPLAAYLESMNDSLTANAVPRWYVMLGDNGEIIGGLGALSRTISTTGLTCGQMSAPYMLSLHIAARALRGGCWSAYAARWRRSASRCCIS